MKRNPHTTGDIWMANTWNAPCDPHSLRNKTTRLENMGTYCKQARVIPAPDYITIMDSFTENHERRVPKEITHLIIDADEFVWFGGTKKDVDECFEQVEIVKAKMIMAEGTEAEKLL